MNRWRKANYYDIAYGLYEYAIEVGEYQQADLAFQANKFSRWTPEMMSLYIAALLTGHAPSKFIFADVEKCLEIARERGEKEDIKYFEGWLEKGVKYLNIDSNNRNNVIRAFIEGEVKLPHGKYDIDGAMVTVDEDSDTYETMSDVLKDAFNNALVTISVYTDVTRAELSQIFRDVNDGKPLSEMEILNSYITKSANIVRELAEDYADYFDNSKWFTATQKNRRHIDQFIAGCAFVYAYDLKTGISLKKLYRDGSDGEEQMSAFKTKFNKFMKKVMTEDAYAIANRNSVFDLFYIFTELENKKIQITDNEAFLQSYIKSVSTLLQDDEQYTHARWTDSKSFKTMVGGTQSTNNVMRNELIMEIFDYESSTTQLDSKRTYNNTEKMILASNSDFKTAEGKKIDMRNLHTNKYHGGHVKPHSKGGQTDISNGAIQEAEDNLKLGANELDADVA